MQVSVVIVSYNTKKLLDGCLSSLFEHTTGLRFEVLVVDNASTDGSEELIRQHWPQVHLIQNQSNLGFGAANNRGAEQASGKHLLFLNSDTLLLNNAVKIVRDYLEQHPHTGACGGNLYTHTLQPATSFSQNMPGIAQEIHSFFGDVFTRIKYRGNLYFNHGQQAIKVHGSLSGAYFMIPRTLFHDLGGFDADFFLYYEETELVYRIRKRGLIIENMPQAKIIHLEGGSQSVNGDGS